MIEICTLSPICLFCLYNLFNKYYANKGRKNIGTIKCVATCSAIEIQPVEMWNSSAAGISFLTYSVGAVDYPVLYYVAAIKLPKRKNC